MADACDEVRHCDMLPTVVDNVVQHQLALMSWVIGPARRVATAHRARLVAGQPHRLGHHQDMMRAPRQLDGVPRVFQTGPGFTDDPPDVEPTR
jgi:hypothetical protein